MVARKNDSVSTADREIVITRVINAPRELVFAAWTDPKHTAQWWGPEGFTCPDCKIDLRVGGIFQLTMRAPDGALYPAQGTYREIVPPERIVYFGETNDGHPCGGGLPPRALVTVTFEEHAGKTTLTLHTCFESVTNRDAATKAGFDTSWAACLERLGESLGQ